MTVNETRERIENELKAVAESFGEASSLVKYDVDVEVNVIEGAPEDITSVLGSLSIGPAGSEDEDRLYLPLDAELDDNDIVDEELFQKNLESFKAKAESIRDRILASDDYNSEVKVIIEEFDREMDEKYRAELDRINRVAKRNLTIAAVAAVAAAVIAIIVLVADKLA
ncbi:MAG: hypothetical protein IJW53_03600 [Clostridia bacterium]|nr:hypothetical protein [Clostridia bacterium]